MTKEELIKRYNDLQTFADKYLELCKKYNIHICSDHDFLCTDVLGTFEFGGPGHERYEKNFRYVIKEQLEEIKEEIELREKLDKGEN